MRALFSALIVLAICGTAAAQVDWNNPAERLYSERWDTVRKALSLRDHGDLSSASSLLLRWRCEDPDDAWTLTTLLDLLIQQNRITEACSLAARDNSNRPDVNKRRIFLAALTGQQEPHFVDELRAALEENYAAVELARVSPPGYSSHAAACLACAALCTAGDEDSATLRQYALKLESIDPGNPISAMALAQLSFREAKYTAAIDALNKGLNRATGHMLQNLLELRNEAWTIRKYHGDGYSPKNLVGLPDG